VRATAADAIRTAEEALADARTAVRIEDFMEPAWDRIEGMLDGAQAVLVLARREATAALRRAPPLAE